MFHTFSYFIVYYSLCDFKVLFYVFKILQLLFMSQLNVTNIFVFRLNLLLAETGIIVKTAIRFLGLFEYWIIDV